MNDSTELKICGLELKGGYHGHPYPQKFVRCDKSQFPSTPNHPGKEMPMTDAIRITLGK